MTQHIRDRADELVERAPICVAPTDTLRSVAQRLWTDGIGLVVVGHPDEPAGVVSERDIVAALAKGANPDEETAEQAMTKHYLSARPDDRLFDIADQMLDGYVRHIPVVDEWDEVKGMISMRDLIRPLLIDALGG